ncbi:MAG: HIT family protein [Candidatus Magasanikbacteria bacterium]|nr:HIT family protein [Candidatus Magasanikbacteria bacterium]
MNCIFCKIINKEVPNYTVYEDENVLAFLDIFPVAKGHTVVIPKKHFETPLEMSTEEFKNFSAGVHIALQRVETILSPGGFNVGWNQKEAGGQAVPHLHVHIIPRYEGDGGGNMHSIVKNPGDKTPAELFELFKK